MNRTSFNIQGQYLTWQQQQAWLDFFALYRPTTLVVMDNIPLALNALTATEGKTLVIHRMWREDDGYLWRNLSPQQYVDEITQRGNLDKRLWLYLLNEPDTRGQDLPALLQWLITATDYAVSRGYHSIVGNIGPATIEPATIEMGVFENYLRKLAEWSERGVAYGGWHEYTAVLLPFGVGYLDRWDLLDPAKVQPADWPTVTWEHLEELRSQFVIKMALSGGMAQVENYPPWWHIMRVAWLKLWADEHGIPWHKCIMTESGHDRMPDLTADMPNVYQQLKEKWGAAGRPEITGPRTLRDVWRAYWPEWSEDRALYEQNYWLATQCYPKWVIGWCLFTICYDDHIANKKQKWERGYNVGDMIELQALLLHSPEPEPEPPPTPEPIPTIELMGCHPAVWLQSLFSIRSLSMEKFAMVVPEIFRSKRFWSAVVGLVMMVATSLIPDLEPHAETLIPAILLTVSLLIGGYSLEDSAEARAKAYAAQAEVLRAQQAEALRAQQK